MDIESATFELTEHLLRASRRKIIEPLEARLAKALKKRAADPSLFGYTFRKITLEAYQAGARHALAQLGPILKEAKRKELLLPLNLPGPSRHDFEVATGEDSSYETVAAFEVTKAYYQGMKDLAGLWSAANGTVEKSLSIQPGACPICVEVSELDWVPLDSPDVDANLHVACRCSLDFRDAEA